MLPREQDPEEGRLRNRNLHHRLEASKSREVVMNGQREILNINAHPPAIVATMSNSSKACVSSLELIVRLH